MSAQRSPETKRKREAIPKGCGWCKGRPWVQSGDGEMSRCTCLKGRWLAGKDRERENRP